MQTKKCRLLPHIWTLMLKLHLIDLLSMLYSQLCNKYSDKSNQWNLCLSLSVASSLVGATISSLSSATLLIAIHQEQHTIFSKSTVAHTKMGHVRKTCPFYGWFVTPLAILDMVSLCTKFESSSFSHSWDTDGATKIYKKLCYCRGTARGTCQ